jgi:predicted O-linked N-acetylglucosamine transferase (SPINDLY family)
MNGEIQSQYFALETVIAEKEDSNLQPEIIAKIYHTLSELALILDSDFLRAIKLHRLGKDILKVMPPLPELHLNGKQCGGVADLYYVSAVIIKQMIDTNQDDPQQQDDKQWLESLTTLVTLTSDSGLPRAAEKHYSHALNILSKYSSSASSSLYQEYYPAFKFRAALLIPGAYSSKEEIFQSRKQLIQRLQDLHYEVTINQMKFQNLDEFILSPTFYLIYYGFQDTSVLSALQSAYQLALPSLSEQNTIPPLPQSNTYLTYTQVTNKNELLRIGFVSSYFRKHSICKLFCQLIIKLHQMTLNKYDLYLFSSLQENFHDQEYTQPLIEISKQKNSNFHFISIGKPLIGNRQEITQRKIDILVSNNPHIFTSSIV